MPEITFRQPDGSPVTVECNEDESLMLGAVINDVEGILAECGGVANCGTCHVIVDDEWVAKLDEPDMFEERLLDDVPAGRSPGSRLSCQITVTAVLDGMAVTVAPDQ